MIKLILASHGELSKGMVNSVKMIVGSLADDVESFSLYPGENPNAVSYTHLDVYKRQSLKRMHNSFMLSLI